MKAVCIYGLKLQILISQIPNVLQGMELRNSVRAGLLLRTRVSILFFFMQVIWLFFPVTLPDAEGLFQNDGLCGYMSVFTGRVPVRHIPVSGQKTGNQKILRQ